MMKPRPELVLIRHAPVTPAGVLVGRSDVSCRLDKDDVAALTPTTGRVARVVTSPARRCRMTAEALFPGLDIEEDAGLWEQDFGVQDGRPLADLPDLGPLDGPALAAHRWGDGESFDDMSARVAPRLEHWAQIARKVGAVAIVAHAGTVRAALAHVIGGTGPALRFEVAPLSVTRIVCHVEGWAIAGVNRVAT